MDFNRTSPEFRAISCPCLDKLVHSLHGSFVSSFFKWAQWRARLGLGWVGCWYVSAGCVGCLGTCRSMSLCLRVSLSVSGRQDCHSCGWPRANTVYIVQNECPCIFEVWGLCWWCDQASRGCIFSHLFSRCCFDAEAQKHWKGRWCRLAKSTCQMARQGWESYCVLLFPRAFSRFGRRVKAVVNQASPRMLDWLVLGLGHSQQCIGTAR